MTATPRPLPRTCHRWIRTLGLLRALTSTSVLAAVTAALPAILLHYADAYTPRQVPSLDQVLVFAQRPIDITTIEGALTWTGWAAWSALVLLIAREILWHLRHLPALLRDLNVHPAAVRRTMTGILVGGIVLGLATALRTAPTSPPAQPSFTPAAATHAVSAPHHPEHRAASSAEATVHRGDTLWAIAEHQLGDPLRWPEIYHLNHEQRQSDGQQLHNPDLIYPGWELHLPATANASPSPASPASPAPPRSTAPSAPTSPGPAQPASPAVPPPPVGTAPAISASTAASPTPAPARAEQQHPGIQLPGGAGYIGDALAGAVVLAAVRLSYTRRRAHTPKALAQTTDHPAPLPEHESLVLAVRTIRHNQQAADQATTPVGAGQQTGPAPAKAAGIATDASGATVSVTDLLAQLTEPVLALTGDGAHDAARALITTAAASGTDVQLVIPAGPVAYLCPALAEAAGPGTWPGLQITATTDQALNALEEHLLRSARRRDQDPAHTHTTLHLLAEDLDTRQLTRLRHLLTAAARYPLGVLLLTPSSPGLAAVDIAHDGYARLTSNHPMGGNLRYFHLRTHSADALARTLRNAPPPAPESGNTEQAEFPNTSPRPFPDRPGNPVEIEPEPATAIQSEIPAQNAHGNSHENPDAPGPAPHSLADTASITADSPRSSVATAVLVPTTARTPPAATPTRITLLGRPAVHGNGTEIDKATSGAVGHLLVYLALHPQGATCEEATDALWPDRDTDSASNAFHGAKGRLRKLLRDHLDASTSVPFVIASGNGGAWRLDPAQISTDLDAFHTAVRTARATTAPEVRLAACQHAADLYTGDLCTGWDHPWLEGPRTHAREQALALLSELASAATTADVAIGHLERALAHDPHNEQLHLRLARIHAKRGSTDAVQRLQERIARSLRELDLTPSPAVQRAFAALLNPSPGPAVRR